MATTTPNNEPTLSGIAPERREAGQWQSRAPMYVFYDSPETHRWHLVGFIAAGIRVHHWDGPAVHWGRCACCNALLWWRSSPGAAQAHASTSHACGAGLVGKVAHVGWFEPTPEEWAVILKEQPCPVP